MDSKIAQKIIASSLPLVKPVKPLAAGFFGFQSAFSAVRVRAAQETDRLALSNLFHFEPYHFRHLDWKRPLDWLGETPFLIAEQKGRLVAALICPPEPPGVAWIRTFAASGQVRLERVWHGLWQEAYRELQLRETTQIAALCVAPWMQKLLEASGFRQTGSVVVLLWDQTAPLSPPRFPGRPRAMVESDLPEVYQVDKTCFEPLWQNSQAILEMAFRQAIFATVIEGENRIMGYQISTPNPRGGHLARLAVHPQVQGQGIGYALVYDLLQRFSAHHPLQGGLQVTVNTQAENTASLAVYQKANFHLTGHPYPVYHHL